MTPRGPAHYVAVKSRHPRAEAVRSVDCRRWSIRAGTEVLSGDFLSTIDAWKDAAARLAATPPAPTPLAVVTLVYSAKQMERIGGREAMTIRLCAAHAADADPPGASLSAEPGTPCDLCCKGDDR